MSENARPAMFEGETEAGVAGRIRDLADRGRQRFEDTLESSRTVIRDNPVKSVFLAAAVGAAVGTIACYFMMRRPHDR